MLYVIEIIKIKLIKIVWFIRRKNLLLKLLQEFHTLLIFNVIIIYIIHKIS